MSEHKECDVCVTLGLAKQDNIHRIGDDAFFFHLDSHSKMELILYARAVTFDMYHYHKHGERRINE